MEDDEVVCEKQFQHSYKSKRYPKVIYIKEPMDFVRQILQGDQSKYESSHNKLYGTGVFPKTKTSTSTQNPRKASKRMRVAFQNLIVDSNNLSQSDYMSSQIQQTPAQMQSIKIEEKQTHLQVENKSAILVEEQDSETKKKNRLNLLKYFVKMNRPKEQVFKFEEERTTTVNSCKTSLRKMPLSFQYPEVVQMSKEGARYQKMVKEMVIKELNSRNMSRTVEEMNEMSQGVKDEPIIGRMSSTFYQKPAPAQISRNARSQVGRSYQRFLVTQIGEGSFMSSVKREGIASVNQTSINQTPAYGSRNAFTPLKIEDGISNQVQKSNTMSKQHKRILSAHMYSSHLRKQFIRQKIEETFSSGDPTSRACSSQLQYRTKISTRLSAYNKKSSNIQDKPVANKKKKLKLQQVLKDSLQQNKNEAPFLLGQEMGYREKVRRFLQLDTGKTSKELELQVEDVDDEEDKSRSFKEEGIVNLQV